MSIERENLWQPSPEVIPRFAAPDWLERLDWVFGDNAHAGEIAPGTRNAKPRGEDLRFDVKDESWGGVRFRTRRDLTTSPMRGERARMQSDKNRFWLFVNGQPTGGCVVLMPPEQVATARTWASSRLADSAKSRTGLREWAPASVQIDGKVRPALRVSAINCGSNSPEMMHELSETVDIEAVFVIRAAYVSTQGWDEPDECSIYGPDGRCVAVLTDGGIFLEHLAATGP